VSGGLHVVSRVILRRFCNDANLLTRLNVQYRATRLTGPDGFGREPRLHPANTGAFEAKWKDVEDRLPEALRALDDGRLLAEPDALLAIKDCLAVHMARSKIIPAIDDRMADAISERLAERMSDHPGIEDSFRRRHRGLVPAGSEARRMEAAAIVDEQIEAFRQSSWAADSMLRWYDEARKMVGAVQIEIWEARGGEFLIGDVPAPSIKRGHPRVGPLGGVPWRGANTIFMPLGRRHVIALTRAGGSFVAGPAEIEVMNRYQIGAAHREIAWHPDADFSALIDEVLGPTSEAHSR
jgi:hypothetical protein